MRDVESDLVATWVLVYSCAAAAPLFLVGHVGAESFAVPWLLAHMGLELAATLVLFAALRAGDLSVVAPLLGLSGPIVVVVALLANNSVPSLQGLIGIAAVAAGTLLLICERTRRPTKLVEWRKGARLGLLVATLWAIDAVVLQKLLGCASAEFILGASVPVVALIALGSVAVRRRLSLFWAARTSWLAYCALAVLGILSVFAMLLAMMQPDGDAAYVVSLKRVGLLLAASYGWVVLGESFSLPRASASVLVIGGAALVALVDR